MPPTVLADGPRRLRVHASDGAAHLRTYGRAEMSTQDSISVQPEAVPTDCTTRDTTGLG